MFDAAEPSDSGVRARRQTLLENWLAVRGATLNVDNNSIYVQDHWTVNRQALRGSRLPLRARPQRGHRRHRRRRHRHHRAASGAGLRRERRRQAVSCTPPTATTPAATTRRRSACNSNVANPDETVGIYTGPGGQGRRLRARAQSRQLPHRVRHRSRPRTSSFAKGLSSPITKEFTRLGRRRPRGTGLRARRPTCGAAPGELHRGLHRPRQRRHRRRPERHRLSAPSPTSSIATPASRISPLSGAGVPGPLHLRTER